MGWRPIFTVRAMAPQFVSGDVEREVAESVAARAERWCP
jgi:hypothetical protein